jgi:hypothetical protein
MNQLSLSQAQSEFPDLGPDHLKRMLRASVNLEMDINEQRRFLKLMETLEKETVIKRN